MAYNGAGVYLVNSAGQPVVSATLITAAAMNALTADLATALSTCILKDGTQTVTANIPFGGYKITVLGAATALTDAASLISIQNGTGVYVATVGGTGDAITLTPSPATTAYVAGQRFWFLAGATNTTAVTVAVSGLTTKAVQINAAALVAGDITTARWYSLFYDGAAFQLQNISSQVPPFTDTNALIRGSADGTKLVRFEVDGLTTGTTRVITVPDSNITLANSPLTTTGDLIYSSSGTTAARLAIGTQGQGLISNSTPQVQWGIPAIRSYLAGCGLSTAGASATMSLAAGLTCDVTAVEMMTLTALTKTTSAWAVGTGNGGMDTGSVANATWYHFYVIKRLDTGVVDVLFSLSATAPTMPTNYTMKRRIGSGLTNGSAQWVLFSQQGDDFTWDVPLLDVSVTNPGTSAVDRVLTVPIGVRVKAIMNASWKNVTSTGSSCLLSEKAITDAAASLTVAPLSNLGYSLNATGGPFTQIAIWTDTAATIRSRASVSAGSDALLITTTGWMDRRGRDS